MEQITLKAEARRANGSAEARRLRRRGKIPAAIMRPRGETTPIAVDAHDFELAVRGHKGGQLLARLDLDGAPADVLLRERQNHVLTGKPDHLDFSLVNLADKTRVTLQIQLSGEPEGVRVGGGILTQTLRSIEVEVRLQDLIDVVEVDVSHMKLGDTLFVSDLKLGDQFHILTHGDFALATVSAPEEEKAEAPADGSAPAAEVEVIAKGKKEDAAAPAAGGKPAAAAKAAPAAGAKKGK
ncbi:MAG: 50S ribosomal protein L25 [Kiritimatiellaeota bacterium]|nr:50S ribosomal protein L25 [Kiritimatiellota bacterium]